MQKEKGNQIGLEELKGLLKEDERMLQASLQRRPFFYSLLSGFGLVSLLYGFEKLLDKTFLVNQPLLLLLAGVVILLLTGTFYNKL